MTQAKYAMPTKEERAELELAELRSEIAKQEAEISTAEQLLADIEEYIQAGLLIPSKIENFFNMIRTQIFLLASPLKKKSSYRLKMVKMQDKLLK
jgi:hypothetical protein